MSGVVRPAPSRTEVAEKIQELIDGSISRTDASEWASHWIAADDPRVEDNRVWKALEGLSGADLVSIDRPYLYEKVDFEAWLSELVE